MIRSPRSNRSRPAAAKIIQVNGPSSASNFANRVPMFPRTSIIFRWGYSRINCAVRRTDDVPTTDPGGSSDSFIGGRPFFITRTSLESSRFIMGPRVHDWGMRVGTSNHRKALVAKQKGKKRKYKAYPLANVQ